MEVPRARVSPEPSRGHSLLPALIVAVVLFTVSVAITFTVGAVLLNRIDRLEQRVEVLQRQP